MPDDNVRLRALEKLLQALVPWISEEGLFDATQTLRADLVAARDQRERIALKQALLLLANGAARLGRGAPGAWLEEVLHGAAARAAPKSAKDFR
jgi:hypothetical protein